MSDGTSSRLAALELLEAVLETGRGLDDAVSPTVQTLEARDRGFARLTALTVLRRLGQIDGLLARLMDRPPAGKARRALHLLRIGAVQMLFLETPPHAAVNACVSATKRLGLTGVSGLVNAVLRRCDRERESLPGAMANLPRWLRADWEAQFGVETTAAIATAHLAEPPADLTVPEDPGGWADRLGGRRLGATRTVRLAGARDVTALPGFAEGAWWVQDAAAALPARLLGDVREKRVIDLCAAPGGKTAQLGAAGARVTAVDHSGPRLERLRENLDRLGMIAEIVEADAVAWRPSEPVDAILLDAPCSATGTLRRHPEAAYRRGPADVAKLATLQRRLAAAAAEMLKPGGMLMVATCSLQTAEGPDLARAVSAIDGLIPSPITGLPVPFGCAVTPEGWLRTHPALLPDGSCDGFFAARFVKE